MSCESHVSPPKKKSALHGVRETACFSSVTMNFQQLIQEGFNLFIQLKTLEHFVNTKKEHFILQIITSIQHRHVWDARFQAG